MPVSVGMPQRSVLGPTMFSLFTNDLLSCVKSGSVYLFIDTTLRSTALNKRQMKRFGQLHKALDELYDWCILNRLTPHPEKSEANL